MPLRISGKNLSIGEALRVHVTERLNASTAKYFDGSVTGHVTICPEGSGFRTDCNLHLTSGVILQADGRAQEPYASFDQAADRIEKRLRRYKSRLKSHHDHQGAEHEAAVEMAASYVLQAPDHEDEAPAEFSPAVIAEIDDETAAPFGCRGGRRSRLDRGRGSRVPTRNDWTGQCGLSARRRQHRLGRCPGSRVRPPGKAAPFPQWPQSWRDRHISCQMKR